MTLGTGGFSFTVMANGARGLVQPESVCVAYMVYMPGNAVLMTGGSTVPVPPVGSVYQRTLSPVAVVGIKVKYWQYRLVPDIVGGVGVVRTMTVMESLLLLQPSTVCVAQ